MAGIVQFLGESGYTGSFSRRVCHTPITEVPEGYAAQQGRLTTHHGTLHLLSIINDSGTNSVPHPMAFA